MVDKSVEQEIKKKGLKLTAPRVKIFNVLYTSGKHLSAEDIFKALAKMGDDIAQATVYRVLSQFESVGLILKHRFDEEHAVYELNNKEHHDHLVCVKCNKIIEFTDNVIEKQQDKIAARYKFNITAHSHYIYGVCSDCEK